MEHLRLLARAEGLDPGVLAREAAIAFGMMPSDSSMLVVLARRLLEKHPSATQLWWLCSEMLTADNPQDEVWRALERLETDRTYQNLPDPVPTSVTLIDPVAASPSRLLIPRSDDLLDNRAETTDLIAGEVWAVCPLGTRTGNVLLAEIERRETDRLGSVPSHIVTHIVDHDGINLVGPDSWRPDGGLAEELL